jgi:hypothetical protein
VPGRTSVLAQKPACHSTPAREAECEAWDEGEEVCTWHLGRRKRGWADDGAGGKCEDARDGFGTAGLVYRGLHTWKFHGLEHTLYIKLYGVIQIICGS